ncbi:MAG: MCE family protein [Actinomycetota bacterium]|nr:MCE family protein [Actinomycetota bacterium]
MKPFRERNPVIIGVIGFTGLALMLVGAFKADQLPLIGGGDTYYANFTEAGGLKVGQEVRVAGVSVGNVKEIELQGNHVHVRFVLDKGTDFGTESGAEIKVKTLLGSMFMALTPRGPGQLPKNSTIPVDRTVAPYDVVQAFSDLSETTDQINIPQLSESLDALSEISQDTPDEFRGAIKGVSNLSRNLAARDEQLNTLLVGLKKVTGVLNSRNEELETLFEDSDVLFQAIAARRESIHKLLVSTTSLSNQLRALVKDTRADLKPALTQLNKVTTMLRDNESSLDEALRVMGPFDRVFANALGTGPWFDTYVGVEP